MNNHQVNCFYHLNKKCFHAERSLFSFMSLVFRRKCMETGSNPRVCALRTPNIVTTTSHEVHPLTNEDIKRWAKFAENIRPLNGAYVANSRTIDIIQRAINTKDALERPPYSLATWSIPILKCDWVADNQLLPFSSKVAAQEWIDKQKTPYKFTNKE